MEHLKQFQVQDLSYAVSDLIFILESPHKEEVKKGFPAAGQSGQQMSKVLFDVETPLGQLVKQRDDTLPKMSILNSSRLPLAVSCYRSYRLNDEFLDFLNIKNTNFINLESETQKIKQILRSEVGRKAVNSFRFRLFENIKNNERSKIVICGLIAQCFFEEATGEQGSFHKSTPLNWEGKSLIVFYESHPSPKRGRWQNLENMQALLTFIRS